jgi:hypothetical protein
LKYSSGAQDSLRISILGRAVARLVLTMNYRMKAPLFVDTISPYPPFIYGWPDTTVSVSVGAEVVRKLPFYCS